CTLRYQRLRSAALTSLISMRELTVRYVRHSVLLTAQWIEVLKSSIRQLFEIWSQPLRWTAHGLLKRIRQSPAIPGDLGPAASTRWHERPRPMRKQSALLNYRAGHLDR